jgi:hypothetical protein
MFQIKLKENMKQQTIIHSQSSKRLQGIILSTPNKTTLTTIKIVILGGLKISPIFNFLNNKKNYPTAKKKRKTKPT